MEEQYKSEKVVIESPMSFTGATKRIWAATMKSNNPYVSWLIFFPVTIALLCIMYGCILFWYLMFGIFLIPFRLMRRSHRRNKKLELQHREMMETLAKNRQD